MQKTLGRSPRAHRQFRRTVPSKRSKLRDLSSKRSIRPWSLRRDVRTLLCDGALHHEHERDQRDRERGKDEENVEIGERGGLLLAQVFE